MLYSKKSIYAHTKALKGRFFMPNWNDIKKNIGNLADKTAAATRELTDVASLKIKIANKESDRDHEYKHLGKLAYARLRQIKGFDAEQLASDISASLERLDNINKELAELKAHEKAKNDAKAADKKAKETKKACLSIPKEELMLTGLDLQKRLESGWFTVMTGELSARIYIEG